MSRSDWRDDKPHKHRCSKCRIPVDCAVCEAKWPTERHDLVERLITATRGRTISERALRDLANDRTGDPALAGLLEAKEARILELEDIVSRLNQKAMTDNRKKAS